MRRRLYGVDFSGAAQAGTAIWIAGGRTSGGRVHIESCTRGDHLPGSGAARETCLAALAHFIAGERAAVFGCDFPFALPGGLMTADDWTQYVLRFPRRYADADSFRADCRSRTGGKEPKRATDVAARTPWAAFNLKLYRQTYHGLAGLLHPLVRAGTAAVLPMQAPAAGKPWLVETCPASILKREGLYAPYKKDAPRAARQCIVEGLIERGRLAPLPRAIHRTVLENAGGDALDSVIAAIGAHRALANPAGLRPADATEALEGRVYF